MALDRALFDMIGAAQANQKSAHFTPGRGTVLILKNVYKDMNDGPTWVTECKVVESHDKADVPGSKANEVGSVVGWVQKTKVHKSAPGNVKAHVEALLELPEGGLSGPDFTEALMDLTDHPIVVEAAVKKGEARVPQPARGMLLDYDTYQQATKSGANAGRVNTYVRWFSAKGRNTPELIAKRRAELDVSNPSTTGLEE